MKVEGPGQPRPGAVAPEKTGSGGAAATTPRLAAGVAGQPQPGQLLQGRVLGMTPDGRMILDLAGQQITARGAVELPVGREFWFEVRQAGPEPWLSVADKKGEMLRFLQQAAGGGMRDFSRLGELLASLETMLAQDKAATVGPAAELVALLRQLGLDGEVAPEKLLRLLTLLRPAGEVSGQAAPSAAGLPRRLAELIATIPNLASRPAAERETLTALGRAGRFLEAMTIMNEQIPARQQPLFWLLPCLFALDAGAGSWLLSFAESQEEEAAGAEAFSLVFFLEMSRLGELQIQVTVREEQLEGIFLLADQEARAHLTANLGELQERLTALGYHPSLQCRPAAAPLLPALKGALEEAAGSHYPTHLVNLTA